MPLTVFQSIPLDGIIVVASPQELVSLIVEKAVNMANMMNIPILGLVENMSYVQCPDCGRKIQLFGESHIEEVAAKHGLAGAGPYSRGSPAWPGRWTAAVSSCLKATGWMPPWTVWRICNSGLAALVPQRVFPAGVLSCPKR